MTMTLQDLESAAQQLAPHDATLTHLCSGGLSTTFAVETRDGDRYALKVIEDLPPELGRSDRALRTLLGVDHPNVANYLDTGTLDWNAVTYRWLTMAFVDGVSLRTHRDTARMSELATWSTLLEEAIIGAAALWAVGIAHCDLTPDNMVVTPTGRLVIVDLGMPRLREDTHLTVPAASSRTTNWMAPEQVGAEALLGDWRSDQYVLGLLGHWLATGREMVTDPHGRHVAREPGQPASAIEERETASSISAVINKMLEPGPDDRWPDPDSLVGAIAGGNRGAGKAPR